MTVFGEATSILPSGVGGAVFSGISYFALFFVRSRCGEDGLAKQASKTLCGIDSASLAFYAQRTQSAWMPTVLQKRIIYKRERENSPADLRPERGT